MNSWTPNMKFLILCFCRFTPFIPSVNVICLMRKMTNDTIKAQRTNKKTEILHFLLDQGRRMDKQILVDRFLSRPYTDNKQALSIRSGRDLPMPTG